jgi:hypothetical protein
MNGNLEIEIAFDGTVTTKTKGIVGSKCTDVDKDFMKELGEVQTKLTDDYYKKAKPNEVLLSGLN